MGDWKGQKKAESLRPLKGQEMRKWKARPDDERFESLPISPANTEGEKVWHGVVANTRHGIPLPAESKGPIRARETRRKKGIDGY